MNKTTLNIGKDCGAYEPSNKSCINCKFNAFSHCKIHNFPASYNMCCLKWVDGSESDLRISVAKLREVLEEIADGFDEPIIYDTKVEDIIERVKKRI